MQSILNSIQETLLGKNIASFITKASNFGSIQNSFLYQLINTYKKNFDRSSNQESVLMGFENASGLGDDLIFFQMTAHDSSNKLCLIRFDEEITPHYVEINDNINFSEFSYPISFFKKKFETEFAFFYMPKTTYGKIYISVRKKLKFKFLKKDFNENSILLDEAMSPNESLDCTLWDEIDFFVTEKTFYLCPKAINCFCLPLSCQTLQNNNESQIAGVKKSSKEVFDEFKNTFRENAEPWMQLLSNQPKAIYSPAYGAKAGFFPKNYLELTGWIDAFIDLYSTNDILVDTSEFLSEEEGGGIWKGRINPSNQKISFVKINQKNKEDHNPIFLDLPSNLDEILKASGPSWKISEGNFIQSIIAKHLSMAIDTNTLSISKPLSQKYFKSVAFSFFEENQGLPEKLQFIDIYSKVLNKVSDEQISTLPHDSIKESGYIYQDVKNYIGGMITLNNIN
jgi:hypothetical protein